MINCGESVTIKGRVLSSTRKNKEKPYMTEAMKLEAVAPLTPEDVSAIQALETQFHALKSKSAGDQVLETVALRQTAKALEEKIISSASSFFPEDAERRVSEKRKLAMPGWLIASLITIGGTVIAGLAVGVWAIGVGVIGLLVTGGAAAEGQDRKSKEIQETTEKNKTEFTKNSPALKVLRRISQDLTSIRAALFSDPANVIEMVASPRFPEILKATQGEEEKILTFAFRLAAQKEERAALKTALTEEISIPSAAPTAASPGGPGHA